MIKTSLCTLISLVAVAALLAGCSTSEPGVKNTMGTLETTVEANPPQVAKAAEAVLKDLELIRVHSTSTEVDGEAFGYTASDKKVSVSIKKESENLSKINVRVGAFGDEDLGVAVITRIEEQLGVADK
ncbi:MAG: DUF3568 family protein [Planctomycetes bacterium]|jgi:PBP1b-binding outer membrane lipoprotein LpoB|nr:DUF3568 family protein [Planctomycetota bacterium]